MKFAFEKRCLAWLVLAAWYLCSGPAFAEELLWKQSSTGLPAWMRNQVIYEVNVRQYSEEGTFAALEADLERLEQLGVGTLWLMPIHPIGELNRKGLLGSYYSIRDYYGINPEFGTHADFASFMEAAHGRGMRVILDWVGNHTAWDNPLVAAHPEYYMTDEDGRFIPPLGFDWTDVIQFDLSNPDVLKYQIDAMLYWLNEYGVDGFRYDHATGIPDSFWAEVRAALTEARPDIFLLAEAEVPSHQLENFHMSYGWEMWDAFNYIAQGRAPASFIDDVLTRMRLHFPAGSDFLYQTTNHDKNSWEGTVFERLGGSAEVFSVLTYVLDGTPLLYNGQEAGLNKRLKFFERDPIEWKDHRFVSLYQTLNRLKATHPALAVGAPSARIPSTLDEQVFALLRQAGDRKVLLVANLGPTDIEVCLGSPMIAGRWRDPFTGEILEFDESPGLSLHMWDYQLLVSEPIPND